MHRLPKAALLVKDHKIISVHVHRGCRNGKLRDVSKNGNATLAVVIEALVLLFGTQSGHVILALLAHHDP
jgi:hypothetical protein